MLDQRGVDVLPSAGRRTNGVQQLFVWTLFQHVPGDARTQELLEIRLIGVASQDDYLHCRPALAQGTRRGESARSWHRQVHDDEIDVVALGTADGIVAVARLATTSISGWLSINSRRPSRTVA